MFTFCFIELFIGSVKAFLIFICQILWYIPIFC